MKTNYLLIGDGRVSTHFQAYFRLLGLSVQVWSRRSYSDQDLVEAASNATHVLCLISDSAIENFLRENSRLFLGKTIVHMSGTLATELAYCAHPLMTFRSGQPYDLETYCEIPFVLEKGGRSLNDLLPDLPNKSFDIAKEKKALYHAYCVMSGNFTTMLWQKAFEDFETKLALPHEILLPYLRQVVRSLETNPESALTGPLARNDLATVQKHLRELEGDPFQEIYRSFAHAKKMEV